MVLDIETQIGDKFSDTDVHLFEFHSKTAGFGLTVLALALGAAGLLAWVCRRHYRKTLTRRHQRLAIEYQQCRCGTAEALLATNPTLQMRQNMTTAMHQSPRTYDRASGPTPFGGSQA